jgi:hypothetical protein
VISGEKMGWYVQGSCKAGEICRRFGVWPGDGLDAEVTSSAVRLRMTGRSFMVAVERGTCRLFRCELMVELSKWAAC